MRVCNVACLENSFYFISPVLQPDQPGQHGVQILCVLTHCGVHLDIGDDDNQLRGRVDMLLPLSQVKQVIVVILFIASVSNDKNDKKYGVGDVFHFRSRFLLLTTYYLLLTALSSPFSALRSPVSLLH